MCPANSNTNPNHQPNAHAWFCPACGGADVTASSLEGGAARCNICRWAGTSAQLLTYLFAHEGGTAEEVFRRFFLDVRTLMSQKAFATALGLLLIKWGFLDTPSKKDVAAFGRSLSRYAGAAAKAVIESVVRTRAEIEKETHAPHSSS